MSRDRSVTKNWSASSWYVLRWYYQQEKERPEMVRNYTIIAQLDKMETIPNGKSIVSLVEQAEIAGAMASEALSAFMDMDLESTDQVKGAAAMLVEQMKYSAALWERATERAIVAASAPF